MRIEHMQQFRPRTVDTRNPPPFIDHAFIVETQHRILWGLVAINFLILASTGLLSYYFAGKTLQPIEDMTEKQKQFVSDASHELRTPITSLLSGFEVYLRSKHKTQKEANTLIHESYDETQHMQQLTDALLYLAQYQNMNLEEIFETINVCSILQSAAKKVAPLAKGKQCKIVLKCSDCMVQASPDALLEAFIILLDNAVKYSNEKSNITVLGESTNQYVIIKVIDNGIGIAEKDIPHIFDRFYRADTARSHSKNGGFGLGLSIAKQIIEAHHGSITVQSSEGAGTTVNVKLKLI